jgi:hypothetical protein
MQNFTDAATEYQNQISKIHDSLGVESNIPSFPLSATKGTLEPSVKATAEAAAEPGATAVPRPETAAGKLAKSLFTRGVPGAVNAGATSMGAGLGWTLGGPMGGAAAFAASSTVGKLFEGILGTPLTNAARSTVIPGMLRMLSTGESTGALRALDYMTSVAKGNKLMGSGIESLFKTGAVEAVDEDSKNKSMRAREKLKKFIANDEYNKQITSQMNNSAATPPVKPAVPHYAKGGLIQSSLSHDPTTAQPLLAGTDGVSTHFPEQAMMLSSAKQRVATYLNSVKPGDGTGKLPFDKRNEDKAAERNYNSALDIANEPMSVLKHMKSGTLTPDHVKHLSSMYPEVHNQLSKRITERLTQAQMDHETPPYKVRQGMSLLLGSPMDSTFTQMGIAAAQPQQPMNQPGTATTPASNPKHSTSKLGESAKMARTQGQSAEQDRMSRDK